MLDLFLFILTDVDECIDRIDDCAENATCTNEVGNFTCICNTGYSGNGRVCEGKIKLFFSPKQVHHHYK